MPIYDNATREKILDARIQHRLATDAAYRNAENAEHQGVREMQIEDEEIAKLDAEEASYGQHG